MLNLLMRLTGGRPMERVEYLFRDQFNGEHVYYFTDYFGRHWMATNEWSLFRVERNPE
jgi:hypothetical protein